MRGCVVCVRYAQRSHCPDRLADDAGISSLSIECVCPRFPLTSESYLIIPIDALPRAHTFVRVAFWIIPTDLLG